MDESEGGGDEALEVGVGGGEVDDSGGGDSDSSSDSAVSDILLGLKFEEGTVPSYYINLNNLFIMFIL